MNSPADANTANSPFTAPYHFWDGNKRGFLPHYARPVFLDMGSRQTLGLPVVPTSCLQRALQTVYAHVPACPY